MGRNVGHLLNWRPLGVLVFSEKSGDPSKCNAQAARCTGKITVNGWDRISSAP